MMLTGMMYYFCSRLSVIDGIILLLRFELQNEHIMSAFRMFLSILYSSTEILPILKNKLKARMPFSDVSFLISI